MSGEEPYFRKHVDLPSTTYATHGLYMYPAKFIPHVVRYVIEKYTKEGDWIFDPFAGYGTVVVEASLTGRNTVIWDLNPMTRVLALASTFSGQLSLDDFELDWRYDQPFQPAWSNIEYWHPREFLEVLSRLWGYWHREVYGKVRTVEDEQKAYLIAIPLLKITRYFSWSDEKVAKLYKSKYAKRKVKSLLSTDWRSKMEKMYWRYARRVVEKVREYVEHNPRRVYIEVKTSWRVNGSLRVFDSLSNTLDRDVQLLVTSPPYLQAQEYIRSFKLELAWLGYSSEDLRVLQQHEIPYRNSVPDVDVNSSLYREYRSAVSRFGDKLLRVYDVYFKSLAHFFNQNARRCEKIALFVGECKIRNVRIPVVDILKEHLESLGFRECERREDKIVARRMFKFRNNVNPATGLESERIQREYLLAVMNSKA